MLRYTLMRLGIFVGCLVVVWGLVSLGLAPRGLGDSNGLWTGVGKEIVDAKAAPALAAARHGQSPAMCWS